MFRDLINAIIEFINKYYGVIVFLINLFGSGYKCYRHAKDKRREAASSPNPESRPHVRLKMTAAHSKYRRRPRRSRRSRTRKKA